jgi:hypothetical protein
MSEYNTISIEGVHIDLPVNVNVAIRSPVGDFYVLNFYLDDKIVFLQGYIGNHPQKIYRDKQECIEENLVSDHFDGKKWTHRSLTSNEESGEIILVFKNVRWPALIQFWYSCNDDLILGIIKSIILSVVYEM